MDPTDALTQSQQYGPVVWFATFVLTLAAAGIAAYVKWVVMPANASNAATQTRLADAVAGLCAMTGQTATVAAETAVEVSAVREHVRRILRAKVAEFRALEKTAAAVGVDVAAELGEVRGLLHPGD